MRKIDPQFDPSSIFCLFAGQIVAKLTVKSNGVKFDRSVANTWLEKILRGKLITKYLLVTWNNKVSK